MRSAAGSLVGRARSFPLLDRLVGSTWPDPDRLVRSKNLVRADDHAPRVCALILHGAILPQQGVSSGLKRQHKPLEGFYSLIDNPAARVRAVINVASTTHPDETAALNRCVGRDT
jgi:hypothetical protein